MPAKPLLFAAVVGVLLGYRLYVSYTKKSGPRPLSLTQQAPPRI